MPRSSVALAAAIPTAVLLASIAAPFPARADEGMWPIHALEPLPFDSLRARGLDLTPSRIYDPAGGSIADAVVQMGATGSFVSPDGLILTNHHVAYGAIQEQSTPEHNYLRDGFYAPTMADEIEAIGSTVAITVGIEDVTERVLASVGERTTGTARYEAVDRITKEIVAETEEGSDLRCKVVPMYDGAQYIKYTNFEILDVRIVYAPPEAIGNYGGEIDNWMWPRHTGDFAFMRAYVAPDGRPADFAMENVPYKPKVYLPISSAGVNGGDLTITIGFPGRTNRYISSFELEDEIGFHLPNSIRNAKQQIAMIEEIGRKDPAIALRMAGDLRGIYNRLKKNQGVLEGLESGRALQRKIDEERGLVNFLDGDRGLRKRYGEVLPELEKLHRNARKTQLIDSRLGRMTWTCDYLRLASELYRWAVEAEKPDMERERGYQERDRDRARRRQEQAQVNLVPVVDKALLEYALQSLLELPTGQKVEPAERLFAGKTGADLAKAIHAYVDDLYSRTGVGDADARMKMFGMSRREIEAAADPFIELAALLHPEMEKMRARDKEFEGTSNLLAPKLVQAHAAWKNGNMYPDANGTMRVSFGEVRGYSPRDGVEFDYHTLVGGVIEKRTGEDPFIVPEELPPPMNAANSTATARRGTTRFRSTS